jgi:hypothetical protein
LSADPEAYHTPESVRREFLPEGHLERRPLLDKKTEPHPILDFLMDEALTRILLVSDGAVAALKKRTTGSKPTSADLRRRQAAKDVPLDLVGIIDNLDARYEQCKTHRARLAVIKEAQTVAVALRYAPRSEQRGTVEWKATIGRDIRSCRIVAGVYGVSLRDVVAYRKTYGKRA